MSQENVEIVRSAFNALDQGDLRAAVEFMDPAIEWDVSQVLLDQEVIVGRDVVLAYLEQTFAALPFAHEGCEFVDVAERICVLASIRGRGSGSGVELAHPCGYVMTVRNGAIIQSCFFGDHDAALKAVDLAE
jgi:ketosteroid isomerase-like protein